MHRYTKPLNSLKTHPAVKGVQAQLQRGYLRLMCVWPSIVRVTAILMLMWASLLGLARLITPLLNEQIDFKTHVAHATPLPLTSQSIALEWGAWSPHLTLKEVDLLSEEGLPLMHYDSMRIKPDYLASLINMSLVIDDLTIQGIDLTAQLKQDGTLFVEGLDPLLKLSEKASTQSVGLKSIRVINGNILFEQEGNGAVSFTQVLMHVGLRGDAFALWAQGMVAAHTSVPVQFLIHGEKDDTNGSWLKNLRGYFSIKGLPMEELGTFDIPYYKAKGLGGKVDIALWGVFSDQDDFTFMANVQAKDITSQGSTIKLQGAGEFAYTHQAGRGILIGNKLWASKGLKTQDDSQFLMVINQNKHFDVVLKDLQVGPWLDVLSCFMNSQTFKDSLESFEPDARVNALKGQYNLETGYYKVMGRVQNAQIAATDYSPSIQGVDGVFLLDDMQGRWVLKSPLFSVAYHNQGAKPLMFTNLEGVFDWVRHSDRWKLNVPYLKAKLGDAPLRVEGVVSSRTGAPADLAMNASLGAINVRTLVEALPAGLIGQDTLNWCKSALLKGKLQGINFNFRGAPAQFPFDKQEGIFEVVAPFEDLTLRYEPEWPSLEKMKGALRFINRRLDIYSTSGAIVGVPYQYASGVIPDLGGDFPEVIVKSELYTDLNIAKQFIQNSPLRRNVGKMYKHLSLEGQARLDLHLMVPLGKGDHRVTEVAGTVSVQDSQLQLLEHPIVVNKLSGSVQFTQDSVSAELLKGSLFNNPASFKLRTIKLEAPQAARQPLDKAKVATGQKPAQKELLQVQASSALTVNALEKILDLSLSPMLQGLLDYQAQIMIDMSDADDVDVYITSDLMNAKVNMPDPFKKDVGIKSKGWVRTTIGTPNKIGLKIGYREDVTWVSTLLKKNERWALDNGRLHFGIADKVTPAPSGKIFIDGKVSWLDVDEWKLFYSTLAIPADNKSNLSYSFDMHFGNVKVLGGTYSDVRVKATPDIAQVVLNLSGSNAEGRITIPYDKKEPVVAKMTRIALTGGQDKLADDNSTWPLPPLDFYSDEVTFNGKKLYKTKLNLTPTPSGYQIDKLQARVDHAELDASGYWDRVSMPHQSEIKGTITTAAAGEMLKEWGYTSSLKETSGTLDFDLRWPGDLSAPNLSTLEGEIELQYDQGRVLGVDPGLGRILSLINLNTILKRLQLDFSDIVKDGFPFDKLYGTIFVKNGRARTNNLIMEGSSARINFYGDYLFLASMLDVDVIIIPNVSGTLPLAAAITAGNPAVGAAVWVVDRMTGGRLSEITRYHYKVTGSLETPVTENKGQVSPEFLPKERL